MNYYELLKIARDADGSEIKRAYFSAVKLHSPDSDPEGFKAIRIAYETLCDQKKRDEYDAYFVADDGGEIASDVQNELLAARALMRENKYKQAMGFMAELSSKNPDSIEAKRLHAEALWHMKKSGGAEKLCVELLEKNPSDCDTLVLRGKIAASRGHTTKAEEYFNAAVDAEPLKAKVWIEYMRFALNSCNWRVSNIFHRAMEQNIDMFLDEYILYLKGVHDLIGLRELGLFDNNGDKKNLRYYDKFAELFLADKAPDKSTYEQVMSLMPSIIEDDELFPFVEKILPALESSRYHADNDKKNFKHIRVSMLVHKLRLDKQVHDVLVDLTEFFLYEDENEKERLSMECYIVFNMTLLRPSIKVLKNEYPDFFKLNQAFYFDVLNEKKAEFIQDKYTAIYKKSFRPAMKGYMDGEEKDNDFNATGDAVPFVRESPKVGRNVLCPCGSGKKYKKCCGKA